VKIDDPQYVFIHTAAAVTSGDKVEAEKILRELLAKRPDDQQVRLVLAEQLARTPEKRAEALEILDRPFAPTGLIGPKAYLVREFQIGTLVTATNLRLDTYAAAAADSEERKKLRPQIDDGLAKLAAKDADSPRTLRLTGKWLLIQGKTKEAVQTLEKARQLAEKGNLAEQGDSQNTRWETVDLLARAYVETGQTGRAKAMLTDLVNRWETHEAARMALVRLLLREGDTENARPHIKWFTDHKPDDPEVIRLVLLKGVDPKTGSKEEVDKAYARLPETNKPQMLEKVQVAMATNRQDDALRLLGLLQTKDPGDVDVAVMGYRVYRARGELDKAREAIASALKVNPDNERLQLLQKQVADITAQGAQ
jgi:predicted Zn-dependent protease